MKRGIATAFFAVFVCLLFAGCTKSVPDDQITDAYMKSLLRQAARVTNVSYTVETDNGSYQSTAKYWVKDGQTKIETTVSGGEPTVTILDQDSMITYSPSQKRGTKNPYASSYSYTPANYSGVTDRIQLSFIRREKLNETSCIVAKMTQQSAPESTIWIDEENGMVLKNESVNDLGEAIVQVTQREFDKVENSVFQVPAEIEMTDNTQT